MKYLYVIIAYIQMGYAVFWVGKRSANQLLKELNQKLTLKAIPAIKAKRIQTYSMQCYMSAYWFCKLRNEKISRDELQRSIYLGAFASTIDELNDAHQLTFSEILNQIKKGGLLEDNFLVAQYLYNKLSIKKNDQFLETLEKALAAQDESIKMLQKPTLSNHDLERISRNKGGLFMLLYRLTLNNPLKQGEYEAIMTLGYTMQLADDMFDIYEDRENNQQTLLTNSKSMHRNYTEYISEINVFINQLMNLKYGRKEKFKTILLISTVLGRGVVCANQLKQLVINDKSDFNVKHFTRKELVCDMEKRKNMLDSFMYSTKIYQELRQRI